MLKKFSKRFFKFFRSSHKTLLLFCIAASVFGSALVYSATTDDSRAFTVQWVGSAIGLLLALAISRADYEKICAGWPVYAFISIGLVGLTFTSLGMNVIGTGDHGWLPLPFLNLNFQPSELLKVTFVITFAKHLSIVREHLNKLTTVFLLVLHGVFPIALVMLQGDDGQALVIIFIFISMIFAAGLKTIYYLIAGAGAGVLIPLYWNRMGEDKLGRFLSLLHPEQYLENVGWQQHHALIAIGSGQLSGLGFLEGTGQYIFARNNDFIFTVSAEEFGFIGAVAVLVIILGIVLLILRTLLRARDCLGMYICTGIMALFGFQSLINIGMTLRLLPVIGITLPFFSAGGNSVITLYLGIGLVLSVWYTSRTKQYKGIFVKKY
ncbi:MAG: FtsW/RodA/SpoVE family cell cycle protein [Oscillospiraceae bacterium]|nr:FtsW/RodA/SpoVE family cell cycle protein [Oscillospiraceae bacterium]